MSRSVKNNSGRCVRLGLSPLRRRRAHVDAGLAQISHESSIPLSMRVSGGPLALDASGHWTYPLLRTSKCPGAADTARGRQQEVNS